MDPLLLSWLFMLGLIATHIIFLALLVKTKVRDRKKDRAIPEAKGAQAKRLEAQISALEEELKKTKTSHLTLQDEIQELNKEKSDLKEEVLKYKRLHIANDIQLERLKKENAEMTIQLQDLEARIKELNKEIEGRDNIIAEYKKKDTEYEERSS